MVDARKIEFSLTAVVDPDYERAIRRTGGGIDDLKDVQLDYRRALQQTTTERKELTQAMKRAGVETDEQRERLERLERQERQLTRARDAATYALQKRTAAERRANRAARASARAGGGAAGAGPGGATGLASIAALGGPVAAGGAAVAAAAIGVQQIVARQQEEFAELRAESLRANTSIQDIAQGAAFSRLAGFENAGAGFAGDLSFDLTEAIGEAIQQLDEKGVQEREQAFLGLGLTPEQLRGLQGQTAIEQAVAIADIAERQGLSQEELVAFAGQLGAAGERWLSIFSLESDVRQQYLEQAQTAAFTSERQIAAFEDNRAATARLSQEFGEVTGQLTTALLPAVTKVTSGLADFLDHLTPDAPSSDPTSPDYVPAAGATVESEIARVAQSRGTAAGFDEIDIVGHVTPADRQRFASRVPGREQAVEYLSRYNYFRAASTERQGELILQRIERQEAQDAAVQSVLDPLRARFTAQPEFGGERGQQVLLQGLRDALAVAFQPQITLNVELATRDEDTEVRLAPTPAVGHSAAQLTGGG